MRSRAAILPYPGDPFLFNYWLKFYKNIWGKEVDKLYIYLNSPIELEVIQYITRLCAMDPKIHFIYIDHQIEHGDAIDRTLEIVEEANVMLIEDDAYIFKPGVVDKYFTLLENGKYDVIGSPRGSCSQIIWEKAKEKWDLDYSHLGDNGPNFWPNFFFTRKNILINTDRNFAARAWKQGEKIEPLDYVVEEEIVVGDTFVNTSLQIRNAVPKDRILEIPQYHASPDDIDHYVDKLYLFDGVAPWTHVGSLSSGVGGVLIDDFGRPLSRKTIDPEKDTDKVPGQCTTEQERNEWERRVVFWSIFLDNADPDEIPYFRDAYRRAIQRIINQFELSQTKIDRKKAIYRTLGL